MSFFQALYDKNKLVRAVAQKLGFSRPLNLELESPRIVEYPWTLRNLPSTGKILDVGSSGSQLPVMLACLGYEVWTIDVRDYEYAFLSKNLHSTVADIEKTDFPNGFFDIVTAVSTIEHIGLGRYGDSIDAEGDNKAIEEIRRIMTIDGVLLITAPFGRKSISRLHRVYDEKALLSLLKNFRIQTKEYFIRDQLWVGATRRQAEDVDSSVKERAIFCVKAVKN